MTSDGEVRSRGMAEPTPRMMPDEPDQAIRFGKARSAQSGALLEDYVELISDLHALNGEARATDIARRLGVSHATVIKTVGRLKREGLAVAKPYRGVFASPSAGSIWPIGCARGTASWSTCCWPWAYRRNQRNWTPRGSPSITSPTRRSHGIR